MQVLMFAMSRKGRAEYWPVICRSRLSQCAWQAVGGLNDGWSCSYPRI